MKPNRKPLLFVITLLLAALMLLALVLPAFANTGDFGLLTGANTDGNDPTPYLSVAPITDTPEPPTATPQPNN